jgi:hypothetical protein
MGGRQSGKTDRREVHDQDLSGTRQDEDGRLLSGLAGGCRFGKTGEAALSALSESDPRYRVIAERAGLAFAPGDPVIVERVVGDATTDWGAPSIITATDTQPIDEASAR